MTSPVMAVDEALWAHYGTLVIREELLKSLISLCLIDGYPPLAFGHDNTCSKVSASHIDKHNLVEHWQGGLQP